MEGAGGEGAEASTHDALHHQCIRRRGILESCRTPVAASRQEEVKAVIDEVVEKMAPDVVYIRFNFGEDWSGDPAVSSFPASCCPMRRLRRDDCVRLVVPCA